MIKPSMQVRRLFKTSLMISCVEWVYSNTQPPLSTYVNCHAKNFMLNRFFYCYRVGRDISKSHFILFHSSLGGETFERKLISCSSIIFILTRDNRKLNLSMRVVTLRTTKYLAVSSRSPKTSGAPWNIYREWTLCWDLYLLPSWRKSTIYIFITFATSIFENTISAIFTQFYHLLDDFTNHVEVYWSITATITLLFINARGLNSKSLGFKSKSDLCASVLLCKKTKKLIKKE